MCSFLVGCAFALKSKLLISGADGVSDQTKGFGRISGGSRTFPDRDSRNSAIFLSFFIKHLRSGSD